MSELSGDIWSYETATTDPSNPQWRPCRPPVNNIKTQLECFVIMASILETRFPEKGPEFWAYQWSILRVAHNYKGANWVAYSHQYRHDRRERTSISLCLTPYYITRPLQVELKHFPAASIASPRGRITLTTWAPCLWNGFKGRTGSNSVSQLFRAPCPQALQLRPRPVSPAATLTTTRVDSQGVVASCTCWMLRASSSHSLPAMAGSSGQTGSNPWSYLHLSPPWFGPSLLPHTWPRPHRTSVGTQLPLHHWCMSAKDRYS